MKRRRALWLTLGTVLALCGVCGLWLDRQQRQYVRNRELIAALERDDTQTALALVSAGADPNTRYALPRASPFQALVSRLLRRSLPAPNASATAFQMACGPRVEKSGTITADLRLPREDIGLVEAMLAHGANVALLRRNDNSALHAAAGDGRLQTVALLLRHGAHVNARNLLGQTPLMLAASNRTPDVTRLCWRRRRGCDAGHCWSFAALLCCEIWDGNGRGFRTAGAWSRSEFARPQWQ